LARGKLPLLVLHAGLLGPYPDNVVVLLMAGIVLGMSS
jgi:hypothetical protein